MNDLAMRPRCIICNAEATCYPVGTGRSWVDRIPLLRWVSQLQAMPWRYTIVRRVWEQPKYCANCEQNAVSLLEREHAKLRAEHAEFNAAQQARVNALDQGGLDQMLGANFEAMLSGMGLLGRTITAQQPRELPAAQSEVLVMHSSSTTAGGG